MKKLIIILMSVCAIFLLTTGCKNNKLNSYSKLSYEEFNIKKENNDTFPLVIGSSTCSACASYEVVMKQFIENYQVEVFYIDLSELSEDEYNKLRIETSFKGTPTTVYYKDGKLTSQAVEIDAVKGFMKENGYIG